MSSQFKIKSTLKIKPREQHAPTPPTAPPSEERTKKPTKKGRQGKSRKSFSLRQKNVLIGFFFCVSSIAIGWSLGKLAPMNKRQEALNQEVVKVTDSIARLEFSIHPMDTQKIESDYTLAIQALFDEGSGFPEWQAAVQQQAEQLDLEVKAYLGAMQTQKLSQGSVKILPATLEIRPITEDSGNQESSYQRVMRLNDFLLDPGKRVELVDMKITASTNSIERVEETLNLWFHKGDAL